jgi:hypothetical protein
VVGIKRKISNTSESHQKAARLQPRERERGNFLPITAARSRQPEKETSRKYTKNEKLLKEKNIHQPPSKQILQHGAFTRAAKV